MGDIPCNKSKASATSLSLCLSAKFSFSRMMFALSRIVALSAQTNNSKQLVHGLHEDVRSHTPLSIPRWKHHFILCMSLTSFLFLNSKCNQLFHFYYSFCHFSTFLLCQWSTSDKTHKGVERFHSLHEDMRLHTPS